MNKHQSGFTYLAVLFFVAIVGILAATTSVLWSTAQKREKERDLLFIGDQFRKAIKQYYDLTPGSVKKYPPDLNALLKDDRHLVTRRYLRKVYIDPMTNKADWGTIRSPDGGVMGIHSLSDETPFKQSNFKVTEQDFESKTRYSDWVFFYQPIK